MTGKTEYLRRQIERAAEKFGPDRILVTSFTRAAAAEIAGRGLAIPESNVGTLHAICYRALRSPTLAHEHLAMWNRKYPELSLSSNMSLDESGPLDVDGRRSQQRPGDRRRAAMDMLRARMAPVDRWPPDVREFYGLWADWKRQHGFDDFTDLLERALAELKIGPGDPAVLFADEAQDFSRLQTTLVRQWGQHAEWFVLCGDPEQCIFSFSGASPEVLRGHLEPGRVHVRPHSYRIPLAVYRLAELWLWRWMHDHPRWAAEYAEVKHAAKYTPRDAPGIAGCIPGATWRAPKLLIDAAERWAARGKTVMILATCGYFLQRTLSELERRGVPHWNPYAKRNRHWNPLGHSIERQGRKSPRRTAATRLAALFHTATTGPWKPGHVKYWSEWLRDDELAPGARDEIAALRSNAAAAVTDDQILSWFPEGAALLNARARAENDADNECARRGAADMLAWWTARLQDRFAHRAAYPARVVARYGPQALIEEPRIIVGTGHSVKGGAADVVILLPDLSRAGHKAWTAPAQRPPMVRLAYVMISRAREQVWVCDPLNFRHLPLRAALATVGGAASLAYIDGIPSITQPDGSQVPVGDEVPAAPGPRAAVSTLPERVATLYREQDAELEQAGLSGISSLIL